VNYETITYQVIEKGLGQLNLNRPQVYNAVNVQMMEELEHFWRERLYDLETRVIILSGTGSKGFCAGLDLQENKEFMKTMTPEKAYQFQARLGRLNLAMRRAPQPIIAAVHGAAAGEGFSFTLASDIRIISENARFSAAYVNIGLGGADMACSYFLPRLIGAGRAYEFMYTGNFMSAQEALALGLVSRVVKSEQLQETVVEFARALLSKNQFGLRLTKEAINMNIDAGGLEQALCMEDRNQILLAVASMHRPPVIS